jgi:hypothetical protein
MSAINIFAFQNAAIFHRILGGCRCTFAEQVTDNVVPVPRITPSVVPRWSIETSPDGNHRLVRHWFENKAEQ